MIGLTIRCCRRGWGVWGLGGGGWFGGVGGCMIGKKGRREDMRREARGKFVSDGKTRVKYIIIHLIGYDIGSVSS